MRSLATAATTQHDLADLINVALEELVRARIELPGFTTLHRAARRMRARVHQGYFSTISAALSQAHRARLDALFVVAPGERVSTWNALKQDGGRPTRKELHSLLDRLAQLEALSIDETVLAVLPHRKRHHFAVEAQSLDAARMVAMEAEKRYTLACVWLAVQTAAARDDLGTLFLRQVRAIHRDARAALEAFRQAHQDQTDELIATLRDVVSAHGTLGTPDARLAAIDAVLGSNSSAISTACDAHLLYADNNYIPFLWDCYKGQRAVLLRIVQILSLAATTQDRSLEDAIRFLRQHVRSKGDTLPTVREERTKRGVRWTRLLDLRWIGDGWWRLVTELPQRTRYPRTINRRMFELCICTQIAIDLRAGDLAIVGGDAFADPTAQLIDWDTYHADVAAYGDAVGLPVDGTVLTAQLQATLSAQAAATDRSVPTNTALRIVGGEPVLSPIARAADPPGLRQLDARIAAEIGSTGILDILCATDSWLGWTRCFSPLSGHATKLNDARARYLATVLCYGCLLGPAQTARSLPQLDGRELSWIDARHISEAQLDDAIRRVINGYNRFVLPRYWGDGTRASADGTQWELYEQNLLAERHIRYGGYGGLGYYHVSDTYIALFAHFIPCGVWEAVYILDGLLKNESDIQPDTVHADTHGQSETVFGLAYLLGITLMPRIRSWKHLVFYRPERVATYTHIDDLFTATADWELIATHLPDMLRVALSIKAGRIAPSTILRRLGTYSRRNKLYQAFAALGRVIRTIFLLQYMNDSELRGTIHAATNKSEGFNNFIQWVGFGSGGIIPSNDRAQQRKLIKYSHLVANCVIFHNVRALSQLISNVRQEGMDVTNDVLAALSPYLTAHINRFGAYTLDLDQPLPPLDYDLLRPLEAPAHVVEQHALWTENTSPASNQDNTEAK